MAISREWLAGEFSVADVLTSIDWPNIRHVANTWNAPQRGRLSERHTRTRSRISPRETRSSETPTFRNFRARDPGRCLFRPGCACASHRKGCGPHAGRVVDEVVAMGRFLRGFRKPRRRYHGQTLSSEADWRRVVPCGHVRAASYDSHLQGSGWKVPVLSAGELPGLARSPH